MTFSMVDQADRQQVALTPTHHQHCRQQGQRSAALGGDRAADDQRLGIRPIHAAQVALHGAPRRRIAGQHQLVISERYAG